MLTVILIALALQQLAAGTKPPASVADHHQLQACHELPARLPLPVTRLAGAVAVDADAQPEREALVPLPANALATARLAREAGMSLPADAPLAGAAGVDAQLWWEVEAGAPRSDAGPQAPVPAVDWRELRQRQDGGARAISLLSPLVWYSGPGGFTGALRARANMAGPLNGVELAVAASVRVPKEDRFREPGSPPDTDGSPASSRWQGWLVRGDPIQPGATRPRDGVSWGVYRLDGIWRLDARREWNLMRPQAGARRARLSLAATGTYPYDHNFYADDRWSGRSATDLTFGLYLEPYDEQGVRVEALLTAGYASGRDLKDGPYLRTEASGRWLRRSPTGDLVHFVRLYVGGEIDAPMERGVYASALSPTQSFANHLLRPHRAPLALPEVRYIPTGGAAMRGYDPRVRVPNIVAVNLEEAMRIHAFGVERRLELFATLFADLGAQLVPDSLPDGSDNPIMADAGLGLALRGPLLERNVRMRLDFPIWVSRPQLAYSWTAGRERQAAMRVNFSFTDLW